MQNEYFVFHLLNLSPPNGIMLIALQDYQYLIMQITIPPIPDKNPIVNFNIAILLLLQLTPLLHLSILSKIFNANSKYHRCKENLGHEIISQRSAFFR